MMPETWGRISDTAKGLVRPGSSAVSATGCSLIMTKPTVAGGICGCAGLAAGRQGKSVKARPNAGKT